MNNNYHDFVYLHAYDKFEYAECDNNSGYFHPQGDPYSKIFLKGNLYG